MADSHELSQLFAPIFLQWTLCLKLALSSSPIHCEPLDKLTNFYLYFLMLFWSFLLLQKFYASSTCALIKQSRWSLYDSNHYKPLMRVSKHLSFWLMVEMIWAIFSVMFEFWKGSIAVNFLVVMVMSCNRS